ncbi:MAG TPA: hypothetical protein VMT00_03225 [Thermoanaerobaculia bacterium]|nr:hypothetical protein [Thermoanaerobaculia bacterium]
MIDPEHLRFGPPRDRRRRKRIVTRRNILWAGLALVLAFVFVSLVGELRSDQDGFGRLWQRRIDRTIDEVDRRPLSETTVATQPSADQLPLDAARREAYLGIEPPEIREDKWIIEEREDPIAGLEIPERPPSGRVAITGDADGLRIRYSDTSRNAPLLGTRK